MKIVHIVISGPFTVGMTYQENLLPISNSMDGHDVLIIASQYAWEGGEIILLPEADEIISNGVRLIRIRYDYIVNDFITEKIRKSSKLIPLVEKFNPDIIYLHDPQVFEILNLAKYKKKKPKTRFIVDIHSNYKNCAKNLFSYYFLHKIFYKIILDLSKNAIDRMYCIDLSSKRFLEEVYNYHIGNVEIFPLGGNYNNTSYNEKIHLRESLGIAIDDIVLIHSGKINKEKKTLELLEMFGKNNFERFRLLIIGSIEEEYINDVMNLVKKDNRVIYLGWKDGSDLLKLLSICDLYVQIGSVSATLQNAICAGAAVVASDKEVYKYYIDGNGWLIDDLEEFLEIIDKIEKNPNILDPMKKKSEILCKTELDYKVLSRKMCEPSIED